MMRKVLTRMGQIQAVGRLPAAPPHLVGTIVLHVRISDTMCNAVTCQCGNLSNGVLSRHLVCTLMSHLWTLPNYKAICHSHWGGANGSSVFCKVSSLLGVLQYFFPFQLRSEQLNILFKQHSYIGLCNFHRANSTNIAW